jgi:hypothetical protein
LYPAAGLPNADPDGDGQSNNQESLAGTNPLSAGSRYTASCAYDSSRNLVLSWSGVAGKRYRVESSANLVNWSALPGEYIGYGSIISTVVRPVGTVATARQYWRVIVFDVDSNANGLSDWEETHPELIASVDAIAGAYGAVVPGGKSYAAKGGSISYSINPSQGYVVDAVTVNGVNVGAVAAYTFNNIQGSNTINATFKVLPSMKVNPTSVVLPASNTATVALSAAGMQWSASTTQSWLSVSPTVGTGDAALAIAGSANTTGAVRSGEIIITGPAGSAGVHLAVSQPAQVPSNVALGKLVTASSLEGASYPASNIVDGNSNTRWSSGFSDPQWVVIDLGKQYLISSVELAWEAAYARSFGIQFSLDSTTWSEVYRNNNSNGGTQSIPVSGVARYVRVYCNTRATSYGDSLWEVRVIGIEAGGPFFTASPTAVSLGSGSASANVTVNSDVAWTAVSSQSWLTVAPAAGSGNGSVTLSAAINSSSSSRTASVTLAGPPGSGLSQIVSVNQAGSGGSPYGFSRCKMNYGQDWSGASAKYPANLTYIRAWLGSTGDSLGDFITSMLNGCKTGGVLAGRTPMMIGYVIAFAARAEVGLQDCDVAQKQGLSTSLCTNGTQYIRQNKQHLLDRHRTLAAQIAAVWGKTQPIMWMTEPDYFQYAIDTTSQAGGGFTYTEAGQYLRDFMSVVKQELPNVVFVLDTAPWLGSRAPAWFAAMPMDMMTYVSAYGVPTERIQNNQWSNTWREFYELTGLGVISEGWDYNSTGPSWHDATTINQLIGWGVVAESFRTPPLAWESVAGANAAKLNQLLTCGK